MSEKLNVLLQQTAKISFNQNVTVLVKDPEDVDMTFVFKISNDAENDQSYTKYNVIDKANGELIVYNVGSSRNVSPKQPIRVGTYRKKYSLYVNFIIEAASVPTDMSTIEITFLTNNE